MKESELTGKERKFLETIYGNAMHKYIDWKESSGDVFTFSLEDKYKIHIKKPDINEYALEMFDNSGNSIICINSFSRGNEILNYSSGPRGLTVLDALKEIFKKARSQALQIDSKIDDAAKLLEDIPPF